MGYFGMICLLTLVLQCRLIPYCSTISQKLQTCIIQGAYKLSECFAKPYFHKYWTEIRDVTTIWKRNVCSFIVTLNAFDVRPHTWHSRCPGGTPIPAKPSRACLVWCSRLPFPSNTGICFSHEMAVATVGPFQMLRSLCVILKLLCNEILR
jgi:hypothetical protein